ncbi:hypothetical protein GCM10027277_05090 [Pseudoduganella ginsengisoli]|uniref:Uncharacterized protein n=1 Tax=Pseudoduganella ginsengisoli TaxID=1462440 RepID=A0A6L6Q422_9BURK|nr:hypothetical protein [Pseudoduganella ginsengisoli]MTW04209.1 hypothetical protein [Pseudoduganella ginsengisoli]
MSEVEKRGRGRPPKDDALTPAERAKRYRDNKRAEKLAMALSRDLDDHAPDSPHRLFVELDKALARVVELEEQLEHAHEQIAQLKAQLK